MKIKTKSILIHASPEAVFASMDQLDKTGMHMMENSQGKNMGNNW